MSDIATTLTIEGKVTYEDSITVAQAAQIIAFLNAQDGAASLGVDTIGGGLGVRGSQQSPMGAGKKVESARDALEISGAKKNPEKIVALAAYVLQDGGETFKGEDVKTQFRRARETAPANFSRDLSTAVANGWIVQDSGDEYYLSNKMDGIFDGGFVFPKSANVGKAKSPTKATKSKATKTEKPEVFEGIDEFPVALAGFQNYSKLKTEKDKLLWALQFAKTHSIDGLSNKDVVWLTDHLHSGIPSGNVTGIFNRASQQGYANRSTRDRTLRITEEGTNYLKTVGTSSS